MPSKLEDRFVGCLLGAAIGDAMGMPTEGMTRDAIEEKYGKLEEFVNPWEDHVQYNRLEAGQFTDDTLLILCLLRSMIEQQEFDQEAYEEKLRDLGKRVLPPGKEWDRNMGDTSKNLLKRLLKRPYVSSMPSASCGAAARVAPIGLFYPGDPLKAATEAKQFAVINDYTHPDSIAAAATVAGVIAWAVSQPTPTIAGIIEQADIYARTIEEATLQKEIRAAIRKVTEDDFREVLPYSGRGSEATSAIPSAFAILYLTEGHVGHAAALAARSGGDTDSIGTIACAIGGAMKGTADIPKEWVLNLEESDKIKNLAIELFQCVPRKEVGARTPSSFPTEREIIAKAEDRLEAEGIISYNLFAQDLGISIYQARTLTENLPTCFDTGSECVNLKDSRGKELVINSHGEKLISWAKNSEHLDEALELLHGLLSDSSIHTNTQDNALQLLAKLKDPRSVIVLRGLPPANKFHRIAQAIAKDIVEHHSSASSTPEPISPQHTAISPDGSGIWRRFLVSLHDPKLLFLWCLLSIVSLIIILWISQPSNLSSWVNVSTIFITISASWMGLIMGFKVFFSK